MARIISSFLSDVLGGLSFYVSLYGAQEGTPIEFFSIEYRWFYHTLREYSVGSTV